MDMKTTLIERFFNHRLIRPVRISRTLSVEPAPDHTLLVTFAQYTSLREVLAANYIDGTLVMYQQAIRNSMISRTRRDFYDTVRALYGPGVRLGAAVVAQRICTHSATEQNAKKDIIKTNHFSERLRERYGIFKS